MKNILLLSFIFSTFAISIQAQRKEQRVTAYAITASQKGQMSWAEVKLIDIATGEEVQSIYSSGDKREILNARTGKSIAKKESPDVIQIANKEINGNIAEPRRVMRFTIDNERVLRDVQQRDGDNVLRERRVIVTGFAMRNMQRDKPFATNSAACAYDKKHERLYYTPLGFNELRYIDLKSKAQGIYYFEGEAFGTAASRRDAENQITRMVMGSDGNGYALTNSADHLISFTTAKKAEITDLGALTDDVNNGENSIHSYKNFGGDMIADNRGKLYLITAKHMVYKIDPQTRIATYKGSITGLPQGYTTNGAIVEKGTSVIVTSATSTEGYYKFDINTLQAEKASASESVYNASDLANSNLLSDKTSDQAFSKVEPVIARLVENNAKNIFVYPNPVAANGSVRVSFGDQPTGKYSIQFMELSGKLISSREVRISNKMQVEEYKLPSLLAKGNYLVKVVGASNKIISASTIVVQ